MNRASLTVSILASSIVTAVLVSCATLPTSGRLDVTVDSGNAEILNRFMFHLRDLERETGKHYRGRSIHINSPVRAHTRDWRKMPVAQIRGRSQGGLTSWKVIERHSSVYFAHWKGHTPDWLVRHEALHVILLSHGVSGHPPEYARFFAKPYLWLPEDSYQGNSS